MRIEVYESYVHGADTSTRNPIDETEEVKKLWESKGRTDYGEKASILVTIPNRKATMNLMKYAEEIGKRRWLIENIYLHTYNAAEDRHYYHIIDPKNPKNIGRIDFAHSTDSKYHY